MISTGDSGDWPGEPLEEDDPQTIGPYLLLRRLGTGGMGVAYLASAPDGRLVAVKTIHEHLAARTEFLLRFTREIANARRVTSAYTPALMDANAAGPRPYLVTEYVAGPTLAQEVERAGPLPAARLERLAVDLLRGIAEFHRVGIVHRDIKPSNVILTAAGARVIDLGLARCLDDSVGLTRGERQPGTPQLMAPEQWTSEKLDPATDIFAWGGVVTFAGTGRWPFPGGTERELRHAIMHAPPRLRGLEPELRALVARSLRKAPSDRPDPAELLGGLTQPKRTPLARWALGAAGLAIATILQIALWGREPAELPGYTPAVAVIVMLWLLVWIYCRIAPRNRAADNPPVAGTWWEPHHRAPRMLQPLLCAAATGTAAAAVFGWWRGLILGLILGAGTDHRICARGLRPVTVGPVPSRRYRRIVGFGLAAGTGLALAVLSHGFAGVVAVGGVGVVAWWTIVAPSLTTPDPRPALRRDAVASAIGSLVLVAVSANAAGCLRLATGLLAGGFDGLSLRNVPASDEIYVQFSRMVREAWLAVGVEIGIWYVLTSATARFLVARLWLTVRSNPSSETRPEAAATEQRRGVLQSVLCVVILLSPAALYLAHSLAPHDMCDGYLGRRQRASELVKPGSVVLEGPKTLIDSPSGQATVTLRWTQKPHCAWSLMTGPNIRAQTWLDRSTDNGRTWTPRLGVRSVLKISNTGSYPLDGVRIRACGKIAGRAKCTTWL